MEHKFKKGDKIYYVEDLNVHEMIIKKIVLNDEGELLYYRGIDKAICFDIDAYPTRLKALEKIKSYLERDLYYIDYLIKEELKKGGAEGEK